MLLPLTIAVASGSLALLVQAGWYAWRDRLIDNPMMALAALVLLGTLIQLGLALARMGAIGDATDRATFVAYALSLPFIPVGTAYLAIKDKSRWAMSGVAVGAFAVLVMSARLQQIWDLRG